MDNKNRPTHSLPTRILAIALAVLLAGGALSLILGLIFGS